MARPPPAHHRAIPVTGITARLMASAFLFAAVAAASAASAAAAADHAAPSPPPLAARLPFRVPPAAERALNFLEAWAHANQAEALLAGVVVLALLNLAYGAWLNNRRFLAISDALFKPDAPASAASADAPSASSSFLARHFAGHGHARSPNPALWWRESLSHAVLWASGRRNLEGALVAVEIRPKQDLLHRLGLAQLSAAIMGGAALEPREGDILLPGSSEGLLLDAFVDADAMPWQGVLAVGTRSCLRALAKKFPVDIGDLAQAHAIDPSSGAVPLPYAWPSSDLAVLTDQPALFQALFQSSPKVAAILSDPQKAQLVRRHLRFLHVTSSFPGRNERRVLAEVKLPRVAAEAEPALELVMAVVDALPGFRQTPEARKRAEDARAAANAAYEARRKQQREEGDGAAGGGGGRRRSANPEHEANQRRMMERRQQRLAEEREKAKREGKLEEWEKQQRAKEQKKMMKKRAIRI
jgi:hypothetical protein